MIVLYIILAVIVLLVMVTIHEFGHYIAGKMLGFKINEFSVGFGPALLSKKRKNGEVFSIRAIPLGGYCAFEGEEGESKDKEKKENLELNSENITHKEENETKDLEKIDTEKKTIGFMEQKPWKRLIVLFFGAFFNFLSAIIFSFILLVSVGYDIPQVTKVNEVNGNQQVLQVGDIIKEVDGVKISFINGNTFNDLISKYSAGDKFDVTVVRDGQIQTLELEMFAGDNNTALLGINIKSTPYSFWEALKHCIPFTFVLSWQILVIFFQLITGKVALSGLGGPITTVTMMAELSMQGISNFLVLLPLIASNLAVFNLLPFPALDGSKMVFTTIEWIRGKPINQKVENTIHTVGLILLFAIVIIADLYHLIF